MLANSLNKTLQQGTLSADAQPKGTSLRAILAFIAGELPHWRDGAARPSATAENELTSDLAAYLNTASRRSKGWDNLQFRTEVPDKYRKGRTIDLAPSPCAETVWVNGRSYTYSDVLLPIECKRLPTPRPNNRDEREYVISSMSSTGGIQRFKAGFHGGAHLLGAMIGYIQEENASVWFDRISGWIEGLIAAREAGWTMDDLIYLDSPTNDADVTIYRSRHTRQNPLPDIELLHLWVNMDIQPSSE